MSNVHYLTPHNAFLDWSVDAESNLFAKVSGGYYAIDDADDRWMASFHPHGETAELLGYSSMQRDAEALCQAHYAHTFAHLIAAWRTRRAG